VLQLTVVDLDLKTGRIGVGRTHDRYFTNFQFLPQENNLAHVG
jgi:hypothetical protein